MVKTAVVHNYEEIHHNYCEKIKNMYHNLLKNQKPIACVKTYGCQQNVADSEKYAGMLEEMGFEISNDYEKADVILFNTCAIRENAENKVFGNIGRIKFLKKKNPELVIILCGCMTEQESVAKKIKSTYSFIDIVFGTRLAHKFPEILYEFLNSKNSKSKSSTLYLPAEEDSIFEGAPLKRGNKLKAFVSVMSGCNNFCSYCIVPYVRGRERSRDATLIVEECKKLVESGYKDITLLGQNVNSYGKDLTPLIDFPDLLSKLDNFDFEYKLRFMTSHPKDATHKLLDTIAFSKHISKHIHLPIQCGSNRILKLMNRKYTKESYLEIIDYARKKIPGVSFTSDIIVGFPGETYEEFLETIDIIKKVRFSSLFTFIYSPREGTPAASLPDEISKTEKTKWLLELLKVQEEISESVRSEMVGNKERVLAEFYDPLQKCLICRTDSNIIVKVSTNSDISGDFLNVKITDFSKETLFGTLI